MAEHKCFSCVKRLVLVGLFGHLGGGSGRRRWLCGSICRQQSAQKSRPFVAVLGNLTVRFRSKIGWGMPWRFRRIFAGVSFSSSLFSLFVSVRLLLSGRHPGVLSELLNSAQPKIHRPNGAGITTFIMPPGRLWAPAPHVPLCVASDRRDVPRSGRGCATRSR